MPGHPYQQGFDLRLIPEKLAEPFAWSGSRTVFVNSMSDLFQPDVPEDYIEDVVRITVEADWHTYQVLTRRSDCLRRLFSGRLRFAADCRHIWWGVSVEDKKDGLPRIADLRSTPAAIRFSSIEPLLEDLGEFDMSGIDWAIIGSESGLGARLMWPRLYGTISETRQEYGAGKRYRGWRRLLARNAHAPGSAAESQPKRHRSAESLRKAPQKKMPAEQVACGLKRSSRN